MMNIPTKEFTEEDISLSNREKNTNNHINDHRKNNKNNPRTRAGRKRKEKNNKELLNVTQNDFSLKQLNTLLKKAISEAEVLRVEISNKQKELNNKNSAIKNIQEKISSFGEKEKIPHVSEHALLRYLERIKGIDIPSLKKEILNDKTLELIATLGPSGTYPNGEFQLVLKDNVVVTVQ